MASIDPIPASNPTFDVWQSNFVTKVNLYKSNWNLSSDAATEWAKLTTTPGIKKMRWDAAWAIVSTGDYKPSDHLELMQARQEYIAGDRKNRNDTSIRIYSTRYIRNNPLVTDEQKREIGLAIPDAITSPTTPASSRLAVETTGRIKKYDHLQHVISVSEPGRKSLAKGAGISEISVFVVITEASVKVAPAISTFQYDGEVQRGLFTHTFDDDQEGMRAWYCIRKKSKGRNKTYGPPSTVFGAIIP